MQVQYCQSANGQPDGDASCAPTCNRVSNSDWDAYRSDCSGYVSYAYGLGPDGRSTAGFAPYQTDISYVLSSAKELQPGDIINSTPREHVMIFNAWLDDQYGTASFFEEPGCSSWTPYAVQTNTGVTVNGDGTITVAANGMTFYPVRFYSNQNPC